MKLRKIVMLAAVTASVAALAGCASTPDSSSAGPGPYGDGSAYSQNGSGASGSDVTTQGIAQNGQGFSGEGWGSDASSGGAQGSGPVGVGMSAKNTVYFGYDQYSLLNQDSTIVKQNVERLLKHPGQQVLLEGYTDPRGSSQYNLNLGQRRANSVREALINAGVHPNQVRTVSYGKECLVSLGVQKDYPKDRRVIFNYNPSVSDCNKG